MAMAQCLGIAELLDALGIQINSRALLYNLCLVNRSFNETFTPHLYRCLRWDRSNIDVFLDARKLKVILDSGHLRHTRVFVVTASAVDSSNWAWKDESVLLLEQVQRAYPDDNPYMRWLFLGLETVWNSLNDTIAAVVEHSPRIQCFASKDVPLSKHCMAALSRLTRLTSVSISFPPGSDSAMKVHSGGFANMRHPERWLAFSGLRRLALHDMYGDVRTWRRQICKTLLNSPQLEHVSLSVHTDARSKLDMLGTGGECEREELFSWICKEYAARAGRPLRLKSVQLGRGILFPDLAALDGAFAPDLLEKVHFNRDTDMQPIPRALLEADNTPRLQEISMGEATMEEIDGILSNRKAAPLQAVRVDGYYRYPGTGCWSPLKHFRDNELLKVPVLMFPAVNWSKAAGGLSSLRHNRWITALAFELHFNGSGFDITPTIETLATMGSLKYLWIVSRDAGQILPTCMIVWLANVCQGLLYIRVDKRAWRVRRSEPDAQARGLLEVLDEWEDEVEGPEFFHVPHLPRHGVTDHVDWDRSVL